ncbi:MAG: ATP-binding cassette domain-containing protein [Oscillospiraceae bacterium]|nr:ATP-binding cassette domain-containing protein [Oscillospiraceae bacterium]
MDIYKIENLAFTYPNRGKPALSGIDIAIEHGEFVTICGPSGCGKTTLLRHLKPSAMPHGVRTGKIFFDGKMLGNLSTYDAAAKIGFVMQSPDNQIVTDKVWHELAFGLESLGLKTPEIRLRVAEMASFFGIQEWFHKPVTELSGGQKQMLALASIMALQPSALILDEPTSQLDPIAAGEFLATVGKINRELGVTVILTEHRLEEAFPLSSRAIVMDAGHVIADSTPKEAAMMIRECGSGMFLAMPTPMRVWAAVTGAERASYDGLGVGDELGVSGEKPGMKIDVPITVREGANWLAKQTVLSSITNDKPVEVGRRWRGEATEQTSVRQSPNARLSAVCLDDVWFKYEKYLPEVLKGLSLTANYGEITAILGGNGTGKTTSLSLIAGLFEPYRGKVKTDSTVYTLPQNPQSLFVAKTVREDLLEILSERKIAKDEKTRRLATMVKLCRLDGLLDSHPYDLSGGEQQRAALAKVLLLQPKILLLDEPTKGFDAEFKQIFAAILRKLTDAGVAVVMASHDIEFCAEHADRCALFFDGSIVTLMPPREFFSGNSFYTTSANRMARAVLPEAVTVNDVITALGGQVPPTPQVIDMDAKYEVATEPVTAAKHDAKLSKPRKVVVGLFAALLLLTVVFTGFNFDGFKAFISGGGEAVRIADEGAWLYVGIMLALAAQIAGITFTLIWKREKTDIPQIVAVKRRLSRRTFAAAVIILLAIPVTIYVGSFFLGDRKYYFISLLVILETMLPFALVFESRKPQARELVIIAVLCAIAVAGRAAFFMLPQFKPVVALVIIAGVAFGGESGFLVGAMTGFVSNFFFGQGPWAPYQMFAFGVIGFLAGVLFRKGLLRRSTASLAVFGAFASVIVYGGIMNPASVMIWQSDGTVTGAMLLASYLQGIPFDLVHAAATVTFLAIISRPMLEKLDRIKVKYGLVE